MNHTPIPYQEIDVFKQLKDIRVVFDIGTRADIDYLRIHPDIIMHGFEPNPDFFNQIKELVGDNKNVYLNNYGLGDVEGEFIYDDKLQAFEGGECIATYAGRKFPVKTLDWYVKENNINHIDFLKIDAEGYDFKVLLGGKETLNKCKYIEYEYWDNPQEFIDLLEKDFDIQYMGFRNVLCMNKSKVDTEERQRLIAYIIMHGYDKL
jgi:FkbM family methyltransferase